MTNLIYLKDVRFLNSNNEYILDKALMYHCSFIIGKDYYYIDIFKNTLSLKYAKNPPQIDCYSEHFYIYDKNLDKLNQEYRWNYNPCTPMFTKTKQLDINYSTLISLALKFNYFMEKN